MSKSLTVDALLEHLEKAISLINKVTCNIGLEEYLDDEIAQAVVVKSIENMGEAAKILGVNHPSFVATESSINWRGLTSMRNVLAHKYFSIDHELVWQTVQIDIPSISRALTDIRLAESLLQQQAYLNRGKTR